MKKLFLLMAFAIIGLGSAQAGEQNVTTTTLTEASANPRAGKCTFQGYFHGIALANGYWAGPAFDLSLGVRIHDYAYVGAEGGFDYLFLTSGADSFIFKIGVRFGK